MNASEARSRALIEAIPDAIVCLDRDGTQLEVLLPPNFATADSEAYCVGKRIDQVLPPDVAQKVIAQIGQAIETGRVQSSEYQLSVNSELYTREARMVAISSNEVLVIVRDITERKQTEEALRKSQAQLEGIISTATDAIITINVNQHIVLFNPAAEQTFQYRATEVIGRPVNILLPERFRAVHRQYIQQLDRANKTARPMGRPGELYGRRISGEEFPVEAVISQIEISGEKYYTIILRDITKQQQSEKERSQLFEAVNRQREQLRALSGRLTEVEETERRQLARELHDQVGQSLTVLGLNLNIIRSRISNLLPDNDPAQVRLADSLTLVEEVAERIRDVMANLRPPVLDDYGLVAALRWYGNRFATRTGLTVTTRGNEVTPRLATSVENALFRVAQEALNNVAKHAHATRVTISVEANQALVRLTVADDGIGFEPSKLAEPVQHQGWGLLTMSERTEAVGGWFRIDSNPGQGTSIIVEVAR